MPSASQIAPLTLPVNARTPFPYRPQDLPGAVDGPQPGDRRLLQVQPLRRHRRGGQLGRHVVRGHCQGARSWLCPLLYRMPRLIAQHVPMGNVVAGFCFPP
jgi:hypothetical protein